MENTESAKQTQIPWLCSKFRSPRKTVGPSSDFTELSIHQIRSSDYLTLSGLT